MFKVNRGIRKIFSAPLVLVSVPLLAFQSPTYRVVFLPDENTFYEYDQKVRGSLVPDSERARRGTLSNGREKRKWRGVHSYRSKGKFTLTAILGTTEPVHSTLCTQHGDALVNVLVNYLNDDSFFDSFTRWATIGIAVRSDSAPTITIALPCDSLPSEHLSKNTRETFILLRESLPSFLLRLAGAPMIANLQELSYVLTTFRSLSNSIVYAAVGSSAEAANKLQHSKLSATAHKLAGLAAELYEVLTQMNVNDINVAVRLVKDERSSTPVLRPAQPIVTFHELELNLVERQAVQQASVEDEDENMEVECNEQHETHEQDLEVSAAWRDLVEELSDSEPDEELEQLLREVEENARLGQQQRAGSYNISGEDSDLSDLSDGDDA